MRVCESDKTETAETNIAKLGTSRYLANQLLLGQKVKGQGHMIKKCKKSRRDSRAALSRCTVTPFNEMALAVRLRRELCTLSSAQPLVY